MTYDKYMNSQEWKYKKKIRLQKDNFTCQDCGVSGVELDVHHITYKRFENEDIFDLVSLCRKCHTKLHVKNGDSKEIERMRNEKIEIIHGFDAEYSSDLNFSYATYNDHNFDLSQCVAFAKELRKTNKEYFAVYNHKGCIFIYPYEAAKTISKESMYTLEGKFSICSEISELHRVSSSIASIKGAM